MKHHSKFILYCRVFTAAIAVLVSTSCGSLFGQQTLWTNEEGGDFYNSANWSDGVPSSSDAAIFSIDNNYDVRLLRADELQLRVGSMAINSGHVTFFNRGSIRSGNQLDVRSIATFDDIEFIGSGPIGVSQGGDLRLESGATVQSSSQAFIGNEGLGKLTLMQGATFSTTDFSVGQTDTSVGVVSVDGEGSIIDASSDLRIGTYGSGTMQILSGGQAASMRNGYIASDLGSIAEIDVDGFGSLNTSSKLSVIGSLYMGTSNGTTDGGVATVNIGDWGELQVGDDLANVGDMTVGSSSNFGGKVFLRNGSVLNSDNWAYIGKSKGFTGEINVAGAGTTFNVTNGRLFIGTAGTGVLNIEDGGKVNSSGRAHVASVAGSQGKVTVSGVDSTWNIGSFLELGVGGTGSMTIDDHATVNSKTSTLGSNDSGTANVSVVNHGNWGVDGDLMLENGIITIGQNAMVSVSERTNITSASNVVGNGGLFRFGRMSAKSYDQISGSGTLVGEIESDGYTDINSLSSFSTGSFDTTQVRIGNLGVIYGSGDSGEAISNFLGGEVRTNAGEWSKFEGIGSTNAGSMNVTGGTLEFESDLTNLSGGEVNNFGGTVQTGETFTNQVGGFIGGRGQFISEGGFVNEGVMAFSAGNTDLLGDVSNLVHAQIITSGGGMTTFFDDVVHNGAEIRTASESTTVFLGEFSGAGAMTGTGTVFFEGDLRPGNSPDRLLFEGDVVLGNNATTAIELAGVKEGEFVVLEIAGNFDISGSLDVGLLDDFQLSSNQVFVFGEVGGNLNGRFDGLAEGSLVGQFGGENLFISYDWNQGNNIALFTAVPEPSSFGLLLLICMAGISRRRRG